MIRKDIPVYLDIQNPSQELPRHLLQGNEDVNFKIQLTRGADVETISPSAKITVVCIYGLEDVYDKILKRMVETNKGNYVLAPDDTGYNITIADSVITVPITEMITNMYGKNQFVLHVEDGINAYTYNMIYYCDRNLAYTAKATPDNLPTYETLKKQVDALETTVGNHQTEIDNVKSDVSDLSNDMPNKANDDLSNVPAIAAISDGNIVHVKDGTLKDSGINIDQGTKTVDFPYSIKTLPSTLYLGDNVSVHENGGFVENEVEASGKRYLMLDYEVDPALGTKRPVYWERGVLQPQVEVQGSSATVMNNVTTVRYGHPSGDHETSAIYLKAINPVSNFKFKVTINGKDVGYYPSKRAWLGKEPGYNLAANLNRIAIEPHFSSLVEYNIVFTFAADAPVNLLGNGTLPYIALDEQDITRYDVALKKDIDSVDISAMEIRDKLSTLAGDERLDAAHIKNLPQPGSGVNEFTQLTDTPSDYAGSQGKVVGVNSGGTGLEFVDPHADVLNPEKLSFSHSLGIKAVNRTGAEVKANAFVFLSPKTNGKFNMRLITKDTHYRGEMFGVVETDVDDQQEATVNIITNIQTGVTNVSEGVACYVGFINNTPGDNSIGIGTESTIAQPFGRCGIFGNTNSIGEYMATFDCFQLQADYLVNSHSDDAVFHSDSLPANIDKEAHLVFLEFDGGAGAGEVIQMLPAISDIEEGTQVTVVNDSSSELKKITLQSVDLINGTQTYTINGQECAIIVAGKQEWYVLYHTSDPTDLSAKVQANTDEINRLKTDIGSGGLPVYSWRGSGYPTVPNDQAYKAYYIHSTVLRDSTGVVTIPDKAPDGAIFSIENNDRDDYLSVRPPTGQTINGQSGVYQCGHDTLNYFVRSGNDWILAYGGVFPNSLDSLKSTIQSLFPNSLHTIAEVQAQLKDRLHTFREIQNEFNNQLHTFDEIEASMTQKGFRKQGGRMGVQGDQSVPTDINSWAVRDFAANEEFLLPAQNKGNQYVLFSLPTDSASVVGEIYINNAIMEFSQHVLIDNELDYKVFISANPVDTSATIRFKIDYTDHSDGHGIEIDDGSTNKAGIKKVNIEGAYLSKVFDDSDEVTLVCATEFEQQGGVGGGRVNKVLVEDPLNSYLDPNTLPGEPDRLKLGIDHGYFELAKPPGYLAYLQENEETIGRYKENDPTVMTAPIWFDDVIVGGNSRFIEIDKPNKALGVQDYTDDDPNVTGGIAALIIFRVSLKGKAKEDGFVEILLKKTDEGTPAQDGGYLLNANGNPIGIRREYKAGDNFGVLEAAGIYMAKGMEKFQCIVEHPFKEDGVMIEDRTEGASGILIQSLGLNYATGDALLQFENDTMQNIEMSKHYNGEDIFNIKWALGYDRTDVDINAGIGQTTVDGLHFYNNSNLKIGVSNKVMHIHDNETDIAYFSLGQIFSAEKTAMLRGKDLDVKVTLQDKQNAFRIYMVKWTGLPDVYTDKIIDRYDADQGAIPETNWNLAGNVFISEDVVSGEHNFAGTLTVPSDANNFAVVLVPVTAEVPIDLYLKAFEIDVSEPFTGWILKAPELINEKHLEFDKRHKELRCDVSGYQEIRYTLNNVPTGQPMPIGILGKGKADIEIDHTVNQVQGSSFPGFEGAIKFLKEGKATIQTDLYVHSEKSHTTLATTKFWYSKVSSDGKTFTKIPLSEYSTQVRGQTKAIDKTPRFEIDVQPNDRIALFGTSDQADGAFIDQNAGDPTPMLKTVIDFDEITAEESDLLSTIQLLDQEIVITEAAQQAGWYIELDYDPDTGRPSLSPKQR